MLEDNVVVEFINFCIEQTLDIVWGMPMVVLLLGTGIILTFYHNVIQVKAFPRAVALALGLKKEPDSAPGEISHFRALCTALSATVGLGNIAGVGIAISVGGPGATFWMIIVGLLGMATKLNECSLASLYRKVDANGHVTGGGPMYYIEKVPGGLVMANIFAFFMMMAAIGGANMFQANQVAMAAEGSFGIPPLLTGIFIATVVGIVILGGVQRIAAVASVIVPFMGVAYVVGCLIIIGIYIDRLPATVAFMLHDAFTGQAVAGGALGTVIIQGVRRALFSSEAGLGSAAVAHSMAKGAKPVGQGLVALLEPFIDTVVICTITALAINITGAWEMVGPDGERLIGVALTQEALNSGIAGFGTWFIPLAVLLFAISTLISWSLYGTEGAKYLFKGSKSWVYSYKVIFVLAPILGSIWALEPIVNFSDICMALMVVPNVWAMIWLTPKVKAAIKDYFESEK